MSSLMDKNQGDVIVVFTASWRYFAVGAILALLGQFALLLHDSISHFALAVSVGLFLPVNTLFSAYGLTTISSR